MTTLTALFNSKFLYFIDDAGGNKQKTAAKDTAKLDRETEELKRMCICI